MFIHTRLSRVFRMGLFIYTQLFWVFGYRVWVWVWTPKPIPEIPGMNGLKCMISFNKQKSNFLVSKVRYVDPHLKIFFKIYCISLNFIKCFNFLCSYLINFVISILWSSFVFNSLVECLLIELFMWSC